jgi:hypothetical protein
MKAYVFTSGGIFGVLTIAHLLRIAVENRHLATDPVIHSHHACIGSFMYLGVARAAAFEPMIDYWLCVNAPNKRLQRTGISVSLIDNLPLAQLSPGR